jgi:VWFA-related protein
MRRHVLVPAAVVLAGVAIHAAGRQASSGQSAQKPQFTAGVDVVEVDVRVTDKAGAPATNLTAGDFELLEDGVPQKIQAIYLATLDPTVLGASTPSAPASPDAPAVPPVARRQLTQRIFVFLLDLAHLSAPGFERTRTALESFLKDGLTPADVVGVVANGRMLGNRLETDKTHLLQELAVLKKPNLSRYTEMRVWPTIVSEAEAAAIAGDDQRVIDTVVARACEQQSSQCNGPAGDAVVRQQVEMKGRQIAAVAAHDAEATLSELQTLAAGLGRFPGPKQVVVFSEGFYTDNLRAWQQHTVADAARSGVHFSTLDARGLNGDLRMQNLLSGTAPLTGSSSGDFTALGFDENADVLTSLAVDTGGDLVRNRNNLRPALDALARETGTYYVIGYTPAKPFDGSYRKLEVKVRRAGLVVRARLGYVAATGAGTLPPPVAGADEPSVPAAAAEAGATSGAPARTGPATPAAPTPPSAVAPVNPAAPADVIVAAGRSGIELAPPPASGQPVLRLRPDSVGAVSTLASSEPGAASDADRLAHDGWDLYAKGQVEGARDKLATSVATGHAPPWVSYALGQAEFALGHYGAAVSAWERVHQTVADYEPLYFDLADGYLQTGRSSNALSVLREAERRWPHDTEPPNALGVVLVGRGALDDAIAAFKRAIAIAPDDSLAYFNLGRAYHLLYIRILRSTGTSTATGMLGDHDRQQAIDAYQTYLKLGGPYAKDARDALAALGWK